MKIVICGSMQFAEKQLELRDKLISLGHQAYVTSSADEMVGKSDDEKEKMKIQGKNNEDAIRKHWNLINGKEAILVANMDKNGIKNYIGGNTLMEIGFAHVLNMKIFLLNPIPEIPFYKTEIEAVKPVILDGDLTKIPS